MKKKIVIVCAGQPSTNPRAIKEATALIDAGYEITFVYCFWVAWALPYDNNIIKENPGIKWLMAGGNPLINKTVYKFSRIRYKCFRLLNKLFPQNILFAQRAATRCFSSLLKEAVNLKADFYIAHNHGALPVAALAAKRNNVKYGFDAEDYHRGQENSGSIEQRRTIFLEEKYLPSTAYITAASPLIANQYTKLFLRQVTVINNVFTIKHLVKFIKEPCRPIKLFWFSQTIGKGRGLEDIIMALKEMPVADFSLTLLGKYDEEIKNYFIDLGRSEENHVEINFLQPVSTNEIFKIAALHDIGLALEQPGELNRDLCLTNKIFTYLLAGNAIIFSNTQAQRKFYEENPETGFLYECGNISALKNILSECHKNLSMINTLKVNARDIAATKYNWENESESILQIIEEELNA